MAPENESLNPSPEIQAEAEVEPSQETTATATAEGGPAEPSPAEEPAPDLTEQALQDEPGEDKTLDIDFLLDIPLNVKVEIGRTRMLINDLLQLSQGSVIELKKLVGEPFDVLVNEKLIARGEIVVVNERFGVRLTDIISPTERIQQLG
jgi:flagellar motor switch protein FliN/FliY